MENQNDNKFPPNPYVIGVPLTGESGFYGRGETFAAVEDALYAEHQNVIVLFGQRRIGKTSLLHQIARRVRTDNRLVPVYFDLQGKERLSLGEVLHLLARHVARALGAGQLEKSYTRGNEGSVDFFRETFLPAIAKHLGERKLLLLFDEFDVLGDDQQASQDAASFTLFPYFQELILHERQLTFIFVVGRRIEELTTSFHSIFKQAKYQRVSLLTPNEARELISQPTAGTLDYEEPAIEAVLNLTARHPYLTQLMCFHIFNRAKASNSHTVTAEDVNACINSALESGHGGLNWFWDGLPRAERFIISAIAHVTDKNGIATEDNIRQILERYRIILTGFELKDAPDRLVAWDILERHGPDAYRFMIDLVGIWIRQQHPLNSVRRDVDYISQRAVRLYENAREAHEQGDLEYARDEYQRALKVNPNHCNAQLGLAQVEYEMDDLEAAIEDFERAYRIDERGARDGWVRALLERGKARRKEQSETQALSDFEAALTLSPSNEDVRSAIASLFFDRGESFIKSDDFVTALDEYRKSLSYDAKPENIERVCQTMRVYLEKKLELEAVEETKKAIFDSQEMFGDDTSFQSTIMNAWTKLGEKLLKQNRTGEALEAFQHAADSAPDDTSLRSRLQDLETIKAREIEIDRLCNLALTSQAEKNWPAAQQSCIALIKLGCLEWRNIDICKLLVYVREQERILKIKSVYEPGKPKSESLSEYSTLNMVDSAEEVNLPITSNRKNRFSLFLSRILYAIFFISKVSFFIALSLLTITIIISVATKYT